MVFPLSGFPLDSDDLHVHIPPQFPPAFPPHVSRTQQEKHIFKDVRGWRTSQDYTQLLALGDPRGGMVARLDSGLALVAMCVRARC
jgi:hypothetical protein